MSVLTAVVKEPKDSSLVIVVNKYSSLGKFLRVTVFALQFFRNLKSRRLGKEIKRGIWVQQKLGRLKNTGFSMHSWSLEVMLTLKRLLVS